VVDADEGVDVDVDVGVDDTRGGIAKAGIVREEDEEEEEVFRGGNAIDSGLMEVLVVVDDVAPLGGAVRSTWLLMMFVRWRQQAYVCKYARTSTEESKNSVAPHSFLASRQIPRYRPFSLPPSIDAAMMPSRRCCCC